MTTPDDSTLNGDEAFEEAWKVFEMLKRDMHDHRDSHLLLCVRRATWMKAVERMNHTLEMLEEHRRRFSP